MKNEVKGKAIVDFEKIIKNVHDEAFDEGHTVGHEAGKSEAEQEFETDQEKRNTEYVTAQFADCKTLSDFQEKYNEIRNRSYNFM